MRKYCVVVVLILVLSAGAALPCNALVISKRAAIQTLLEDACRISGVPGMSVAIVRGGKTHYVSVGYADREGEIRADEATLYELASVSKAFTAAGILLLAEQGHLALSDPVQKHIPWLSFSYQGSRVDMDQLTLNRFLHHTSGLTNSKHFDLIPRGSGPEMLRLTVEALKDAELSSPVGSKFEYGTMNYDVLGLVIEKVSGQSYETFMEEKILEPLGLQRTFMFAQKAQTAGQLAKGYRTSFFITSPYEAPPYEGNKPAGYIISCARDMARWMQIQMGLVEGIPEVLKTALKKSQAADRSVQDWGGLYYAGGWQVNADQTVIEHSGGNPNFATQVYMFPREQIGITLLSNGAFTNLDLVLQIKGILDGNLEQTYSRSGAQIADAVLSVITILALVASAVFFYLGFRRRKTGGTGVMTGKRRLLTAFWLGITLSLCALSLFLPKLMGMGWRTILIWSGYSSLLAPLSLSLLSAGITWFVCTHPHKRPL